MEVEESGLGEERVADKPCHFLTEGSGTGFEMEWILLKKGFFAL